MHLKITIISALVGLAMSLSPGLWAETATATGAAAMAGGAGATVNLNFQIVIPEFIEFRVGDAVTIDTIEFQPTAADVQAGTAGTAATAASGDLGNGVVTVTLRSNAGALQITSDTTGATGLVNGADTISYAQIQTATTNAALTPPVLMDNAMDVSPVVPNIGASVTDLAAVWTYTYDNPAVPPAAGTYTGSGTYTAAVP